MKTSKLWWIGFGMYLKTEGRELLLRKGSRKLVVDFLDLKRVRIERRFFRGHTLVISLETAHKPIYFRMSKRGAKKAKLWIEAQQTHILGAS